ncbi:hypothetical protein SDRG_06826 [Saprolegnia diclina VS20]|uniref:Uncharacterized protein n=1 Tax=Saprolegnia diclina (strain VS20) TaxID=1156394 RepID=T0QNX5_SAPDV|nr:hypothetical protein SDRG_06826 [Saprolegnia diclina VS20]EQC35535.1 hypothetical protein SDRG_06826 [Saprolegnia diclina VS20]|eukprot:XP_008610852.1 hypothetical protein SDRG_06826 [Saprolegnia diclina VS20]
MAPAWARPLAADAGVKSSVASAIASAVASTTSSSAGSVSDATPAPIEDGGDEYATTASETFSPSGVLQYGTVAPATLPSYVQYYPTDAPTTATLQYYLTDAPTKATSFDQDYPTDAPTTATPVDSYDADTTASTFGSSGGQFTGNVPTLSPSMQFAKAVAPVSREPESATDANSLSAYAFAAAPVPQDIVPPSSDSILDKVVAYITTAPAPPAASKYRTRPQCVSTE